jgi:hypothetical protein
VALLEPQLDRGNLMRPSLINSILLIFISLFLYTPCPASFAADDKSEALWFINLIKENNGKTFCAPSNATLKAPRYTQVQPPSPDVEKFR